MQFKRPQVRYADTPQPATPYQSAAQVWDERIGSARVQAKNWRYMAFGSLILSAGFAGALVIQSARGTVVPWVVQVDKLGQAHGFWLEGRASKANKDNHAQGTGRYLQGNAQYKRPLEGADVEILDRFLQNGARLVHDLVGDALTPGDVGFRRPPAAHRSRVHHIEIVSRGVCQVNNQVVEDENRAKEGRNFVERGFPFRLLGHNAADFIEVVQPNFGG